jgi:hypothetical protein
MWNIWPDLAIYQSPRKIFYLVNQEHFLYIAMLFASIASYAHILTQSPFITSSWHKLDYSSLKKYCTGHQWRWPELRFHLLRFISIPHQGLIWIASQMLVGVVVLGMSSKLHRLSTNWSSICTSYSTYLKGQHMHAEEQWCHVCLTYSLGSSPLGQALALCPEVDSFGMCSN